MAAGKAAKVPAQGSKLSDALPVAYRPLARSFYSRSSLAVAPDLLGRVLVRRTAEGLVAGRIVECESYMEEDPASHSFRGPTPRSQVMFGPPGHLYVYFTYGMHYCCNVVTGSEGQGSAVLLRALEPIEGLDLMRERRGVMDERLLCSGPGRLTQAFGIGREENGADLVTGSDLWIGRGTRVAASGVGIGPRVGISVATESPWRFFEAGNRFLSRGPGGPRGRRTPRNPSGRRRGPGA